LGEAEGRSGRSCGVGWWRAAAVALATLCITALAAPAEATFPGKNGKIAFSSPARIPGAIETIEPDGTSRAVLTTGISPAWSADGAKLAFSYDYYNSLDDTGSQIVSVGADGGNRTVIVNECGSSCKVFVGTPSWSPDGSRLSVHDTVCGPSECGTSLRVIDASGHFVAGLGAGFSSNWSPVGTRVAIDRYADFGSPACDGYFYCNSEIFTIGPDGNGLARVTNNPANDIAPSWSPDGTKIAFASGRDGNGEIYTVNADGTGEKRLTDNGALDTSPAWSPDGSKIAFHTNRDGDYELYVMNADGTGLANLTNTPDVNEFDPDWQPLPGPQRGDYKNAAQFCKALREFLGYEVFRGRYGDGANAYGKCVGGYRQ
jgi:dipeptidyl aminopeptidase/acylaminoacyl peptidase